MALPQPQHHHPFLIPRHGKSCIDYFCIHCFTSVSSRRLGRFRLGSARLSSKEWKPSEGAPKDYRDFLVVLAVAIAVLFFNFFLHDTGILRFPRRHGRRVDSAVGAKIMLRNRYSNLYRLSAWVYRFQSSCNYALLFSLIDNCHAREFLFWYHKFVSSHCSPFAFLLSSSTWRLRTYLPCARSRLNQLNALSATVNISSRECKVSPTYLRHFLVKRFSFPPSSLTSPAIARQISF